VGLNEWAQNFVRTPGVRKETSGEFFPGATWDAFGLHKYIFPDGKVYFERLQTQVNTGLHLYAFLALQDKKANWVLESLWSQEAIEKALA